jgi:DNA-binding NarL/FixJ family response regulator
MIAAKPVRSKPRYRVLVCDDVGMMRQAVRSMFEDAREFEVVDEAVGGQDAIMKAIALKPDLIVMDFSMPDLDGAEATRQILDRVPGTKVLAWSSDASWETVDRMFAAGALGYVVKGPDGEELVRAARAILAGAHFLSLALFRTGRAEPEPQAA